MTDKPLKRGTGNLTEIIPISTSAGSADAGKLAVLGADGKWDDSLLHDDVTNSFTSSEALSAGALANIWSSSGAKVRNADASSAIPAMGFAPAGITNGGTGNVVLADGIISGLVGLTIGATYYLGNGGAITATPPTTSGYIWQVVGVAISTTELAFSIGPPVLLG